MDSLLAAISYPPVPIFELGPLRLSLHGVFAGVGFVAGGYLWIRDARKRGFDDQGVISALTWGLVGAILGARLFTVPAHLGDVGYGLSDVISPAGFYSILGGFAGGIIAGVIRFRMLGMAPLANLDMAAYGLAMGTAVGRIGDLFIAEHLGGPTTFFLGFELKPGYDVAPQHNGLETLCDAAVTCGPFHHAGLYDMIGAAVLLGLLYLIARRWRARRYGMLFLLWAVWYGLQRFAIDFTRNSGDAFTSLREQVAPGSAAERALDGVIRSVDATLGPFTWNQLSGLGIAIVATAAIIWIAVTRRTPVVSVEEDVVRGAVLATSAPTAAPDDPGR